MKKMNEINKIKHRREHIRWINQPESSKMSQVLSELQGFIVLNA